MPDLLRFFTPPDLMDDVKFTSVTKFIYDVLGNIISTIVELVSSDECWVVRLATTLRLIHKGRTQEVMDAITVPDDQSETFPLTTKLYKINPQNSDIRWGDVEYRFEQSQNLRTLPPDQVIPIPQ